MFTTIAIIEVMEMGEENIVEMLKKEKLEVKRDPELLRRSVKVIKENMETIALATHYAYKIAQLMKDLKEVDEQVASAITSGLFTQILRDLKFKDEYVIRLVYHLLVSYFRDEDVKKIVREDKESREAVEQVLKRYDELLKSISGQAEVSGNGG